MIKITAYCVVVVALFSIGCAPRLTVMDKGEIESFWKTFVLPNSPVPDITCKGEFYFLGEIETKGTLLLLKEEDEIKIKLLSILGIELASIDINPTGYTYKDVYGQDLQEEWDDYDALKILYDFFVDGEDIGAQIESGVKKDGKVVLYFDKKPKRTLSFKVSTRVEELEYSYLEEKILFRSMREVRRGLVIPHYILYRGKMGEMELYIKRIEVH